MKSVHFGMMFLFLGIGTIAEGQLLKKLKNRTEQALGNAAGNQIDKAVNKGVDKAVEKKKDKVKPGNSQETTLDSSTNEVPAAAITPDRIKAYSKYDFVQGKDLLLTDDF